MNRDRAVRAIQNKKIRLYRYKTDSRPNIIVINFQDMITWNGRASILVWIQHD